MSEFQKLTEATCKPNFPKKSMRDKKHPRRTGQACPLSIHTIDWQTHSGQEMFILLCKSLQLTFEITNNSC